MGVFSMSIYYVRHPNIDSSAVVHAPTTEKARTTFLDYLERRGAIQRRLRQALRENMVAEKIDSPYGVSSDIELYYQYSKDEVEDIGRVTLGRQPIDEVATEEPEEEVLQLGGEMVEIPLDEEGRAIPQEERLSPIQELALGG